MREILREAPILPPELCQEDRRELDEAVLELIGIASHEQRMKVLEELYHQTTNYYRYQRTQDIQAMEDRSGKKNNHLGPQDLAESIWFALPENEKTLPLVPWLEGWPETELVEIPEGEPEALGAADMFNPTAVTFKGNK